jgi:RND family efflux transporter MFP subunit
MRTAMKSALKRQMSRGSTIRTLFLSSLLLIAACEEAPAPVPPKPVRAIQVSGASDLAEGVFPGRARAGLEVNLSFRVSGKLLQLPVAVGDQVKVGARVAALDPQDFQQQLNAAQSTQQAAKAEFRRAEADYNRLLKVQQEDAGATSQRAVDLALSIRDQARAASAALGATVQTARDRLGYTELKAPFGGEVVETYVENFQTVVASQPILRLLDPSSIEMTVSIPENLIGYADYVTRVTIAFDALPGTEVAASIKEIGSEASQATRTYPLTLVMAQPEGGKILPGMAGKATIQARLPESAGKTGISIPASAVFAGSDIKVTNVWVVDTATSTLSRREVETGEPTTSGLLIKSGLQAGEWIVTAGTHSLTEGQVVKIVDAGDAQ